MNRAVILMGPRRVGKTVLLQQTIQQLITDGMPPNNIIYLSVDTPLLQGLALETLLDLYCEVHGRKNPDSCVIIFDEIQYHADWDHHLKVLVDSYKKTRFVASGSAAAALQRKSKESGAGRFTDFLLPPLTFHEYLDLLNLTDKLIERTTGGLVAKDINALNAEFIKYLNYGGYPEAVFNEDIQRRPERFIRSDIIEKVLLRDLPSLYGIQDIQELTLLFNTLAYQTGNEVTYEGLSKSSGVAKNTIKKYIEYLEAAFLIKTISRVDNSGKTFKRTNYFKVYLTNPSMYAAIFGLIDPDRDEIGSLVETALFSQYMHDPNIFSRIFYARWNGGEGEVDLVHLDEKYRVRGATEVKWSDRFFDNPSELKNLIQFCKECGLRLAYVSTRTKHGKRQVANGLTLNFLESSVACHLIGEELLKRGRTPRDPLLNEDG